MGEQKLRNPGERSSTLSFGGGFAPARTNSFGLAAKIPRKKRLFLFLFWTSKKEKKKKNDEKKKNRLPQQIILRCFDCAQHRLAQYDNLLRNDGKNKFKEKKNSLITFMA